jgi:hypothetical protein
MEFRDNALSDIGEKQLVSALWLWPRVTPVPAAEISSDTIQGHKTFLSANTGERARSIVPA